MKPTSTPDRRASLRSAPLPPSRSRDPQPLHPGSPGSPGSPGTSGSSADASAPLRVASPIVDAARALIDDSSGPQRSATVVRFIDVAPRLWVPLAYLRWYRWNVRVIAKLREAGVLYGNDRSRPADEAGQSTVEYALVLLGAAAVALALVAWVTRSDFVSRLFDGVVGRVLSQAG